MKVGAEPKKVAFLTGLLVVAGYLYYSNSTADSGPESKPAAAAAKASSAPTAGRAAPARLPTATARTSPAPAARGGSREFRPSLKPRRAEDRPDPMTIDPTLRLDLLAKLQQVEGDSVKRSLFDFSKPPPPKVPEPKIIPKTAEELKKIQAEADAKAAKKDSKPPPPPINLKFYGYISPASSQTKRAFFLDGEDIFVAEEGELIRKRYKVVKIGVNSAVLEDTEHDHQQTLRLEEQKG